MVQVGTGLQEGFQAEVVETQPLQEVRGSLGCRDLHLYRLGEVVTYMFQQFLHKFACGEDFGSFGSNLDV